jgi:hypothetical protein
VGYRRHGRKIDVEFVVSELTANANGSMDRPAVGEAPRDGHLIRHLCDTLSCGWLSSTDRDRRPLAVGGCCRKPRPTPASWSVLVSASTYGTFVTLRKNRPHAVNGLNCDPGGYGPQTVVG